MTSPAGMLSWLGHALGQVFLVALLLSPALAKGQQPAVVAQRNLVKEIELQHIGPRAASDEFIFAHIRLKKGEPFRPLVTDDDIESLMATNFFRTVNVKFERENDGVVVRYVLRSVPTVTEIRFDGNSGRKFRRSKLMRKIRSRVGDTLNGLALASDSRAIEKEYNKAGYHQARVTFNPEEDLERGQASVTFEIEPGPRVKIDDIIFEAIRDGEKHEPIFTQRQLRKVIKTRRHWWMSWLTGSGKFEEDQWDLDKDDLKKFYHSFGYIDFDIVDEVIERNEKGNKMVIRLTISEGFKYRVGDVTFEGNTDTVYSDADLRNGRTTFEYHVGPRLLPGYIFTPELREEDARSIKELYEMKGYLDVDVNSEITPNTGTGEIDIHYTIEENEPVEVERIEIRGNTTTKDKVIRRELAINPGDTFDMVSVNLSKRRLEGTGLFERVETEVEQIEELPNKRNLVIGVTEGRTGNIMMGFGYGSIMSLYAQVGYTQGNFDLFNPPFFTGGGQKFRLQVTAGRRHEDYMITFEEPFLFDKKLRLAVDLYHRDNRFLSHYFTQKRTGARVGLSRTLWDDYTYGGVNYTFERVGIHDRSYYTYMLQEHDIIQGGLVSPTSRTTNPFDWEFDDARRDEGEYAELNHDRMVSKFGTFLAYSTLNHGLMPTRGQNTQFTAEIAGGPFGGETEMYQLELESSYYFPGLMRGHVLELVGRIGVVDSFGGSSRVPYFDRFFLGGTHSMRGYDHRDIGPRLKKWKLSKGTFNGAQHYGYHVDVTKDGKVVEKDKFVPVQHTPSDFPFSQNGTPHQTPVFSQEDGTVWNPVMVDSSEPLGGSSYWFGSAEYTIPIIERLRFAVFYDIGMSYLDPYEFDLGEYADNWGVGLRLTVPMLGPLRLDYGFPITHPDYVDGGGEFHFGVGYNRTF